MAHDLRLVSFNVNGLRPMLRTKARSLKKVLEDDLQAGESFPDVAEWRCYN